MLAELFEKNRKQLRSVAYRMLGSLSEADDAVQEAWLRLSRTDASSIENLARWLTTVVARVSLDMLRVRRSRAEEPAGARIPDPMICSAEGVDLELEDLTPEPATADGHKHCDPEHEAIMADSISLALLVVLETLAESAAKAALIGARLTAAAQLVIGNGAPGVIAFNEKGEPRSIVAFTVRRRRITQITVFVVRNRLRRLELAAATG